MFPKNQENVVLATLIGGAVGAAAALLLAPASGADTRKQLRHVVGASIHAPSRLAHQAAVTHVKKKKKRTKSS